MADRSIDEREPLLDRAEAGESSPPPEKQRTWWTIGWYAVFTVLGVLATAVFIKGFIDSDDVDVSILYVLGWIGGTRGRSAVSDTQLRRAWRCSVNHDRAVCAHICSIFKSESRILPARRYRSGSASSKTGNRTGQRTRQSHAYNLWFGIGGCGVLSRSTSSRPLAPLNSAMSSPPWTDMKAGRPCLCCQLESPTRCLVCRSRSMFDGCMYALLLSKEPPQSLGMNGGTHRIAAARSRGRVQSRVTQ
ncbi:hypothetical protein K466DRAFT_324632 [Polyporus arcularius HHB13444]|uniref:Uncharacterized protein n=1 Tax=Polyporus arcularius HHB13444 TaxID=1314778 RepID=A0A5C3PXZ7_9APHY|nr:hypothetical protein K466DRAFT_324632 [Polyporus arcularius HHB13444]